MDLIYNCCLNVVENGVKLYKLRMSERVGSIFDTSGLNGVVKQALASAQESQELVKVCAM